MKLPTGRQALGWILVAFIIYAVFTAPGKSADTTSSGWGKVKNGYHSITTFFDGLIDS